MNGMVGYVYIRALNHPLHLTDWTPHSAINAPTVNNTFEAFQAAAKTQSGVVAPTPALSGVNALASAAPGPLTGNFTGVAVPTGTAGTSGNGTSGSNSTGTGTSTGTSTSTGKPNGASAIQISGLTAFVAAAFGIVFA